MSSLIAAGAVLAGLFLATRPVVLDASRYGDGLRVTVAVMGMTLRLGGDEKRERKKQKKRPPDPERMRILAKNGYTTLCRMIPRVRVDRLTIRFTAGGRDPSAAAQLYAGAGMALDALSRLAEERVDELSLSADVELLRERAELMMELRVSARAYRLLAEAALFAAGVARDRLAYTMKKG